MVRTTRKQLRQERLEALIKEDPFFTDEALAKRLQVSIQTIRLDRLELGIPELRERVKQVAEKATAKLRTLQDGELVGELLDLELGHQAISLLEISREMVFTKTGVARGHHLFAQANSLAVAVINANVALTGSAQVKFKSPVKLGGKVVAKAVVSGDKGQRFCVTVRSTVEGEEVFHGEFIIFAKGSEEELSDAYSS
ncbi:MAG TPA: transcription factor FapR [Verrucomicrobiae bacterium]|nr:transcription factor FapR [Verrucomicrobiae bacterium]